MHVITNAVKQMARDKLPGSSGFQVDFYIIFWEKFKCYLYEAYQESIKIGNMSPPQRQGLITLIPKKRQGLDVCEKLETHNITKY